MRPFPVMEMFKFTPVVGLDFQSIGMDELAVTLPTLGTMPITPDGVDAVSLRVGLRGECLRLRSRIQYIRQLSGDDYMSSSVTLNNATRNVRGSQWGKDWVNVGIGSEILQLRNFRLFADYDFDIGKNTTSHLGSVNAVLMW